MKKIFALLTFTSFAFDKIINNILSGGKDKTQHVLFTTKCGFSNLDDFKQNVVYLGGDINYDSVQFENTTGRADINSDFVMSSFSSTTSSFKNIKGWFYKNKLAMMDIEVNEEYEKVYKAISKVYGEAHVNNANQESVWNKLNVKIFLCRVGNVSSVVIVNNKINEQRLQSNKFAFNSGEYYFTEEALLNEKNNRAM